MALIYTSISCWETWGAETLVCAQQPEVVKKQQLSETMKDIAILLQKKELYVLMAPTREMASEYDGTQKSWKCINVVNVSGKLG